MAIVPATVRQVIAAVTVSPSVPEPAITVIRTMRIVITRITIITTRTTLTVPLTIILHETPAHSALEAVSGEAVAPELFAVVPADADATDSHSTVL